MLFRSQVAHPHTPPISFFGAPPMRFSLLVYMSRVSYSSVVDSLIYAMVCSRPDLSYAMSLVSRYMANPCKEHWKVVQWIFRYLFVAHPMLA